MALQSVRSLAFVRLLVVALAFATVATVGLAAIPTARGNFTPPGLALASGKYTGTNIYVPGEVLQITLTATPGDSIDVLIQNASGTPSASINGVQIGTSGLRTLQWTVPVTWPDGAPGASYSVSAHDTTSGQTRVRDFGIETYVLSVWTDRAAYLPGDSVTVSWSAVLVQNGSSAPSGVGVLEVYDQACPPIGGAGTSLLPAAQFNFSASRGTYSFALSAAVPTPRQACTYAWFNDTAGLRTSYAQTDFGVNQLGVNVAVQRPTYAPGDVVTVAISTVVLGVPPFVPTTGEPNISVSVNVTDLVSGTVVTGYSQSGLVTDASGNLNYVFQLTATPTTGSYEVDATATAHGTLSATNSDTFNVQPTASLSVQLTLDKLQYASGDALTATAQVFSTGTPTLTYTWSVTDIATGNTLAMTPGGAFKYTFAIPTTYQGTLRVSVLVNDGNGTTRSANAQAFVAFGYLALTLDKSQFNPLDSITATYSLQSRVITNPTYYWEVRDAGGTTVAAGSTTAGTVTYTTPNPASNSYTFIVTASQNGRTVQAQQTAYQVSGYFLVITLDRPTYNPGDTMTITYTIAPRGTSVLPVLFSFYINLFGVTSKNVATTSASGTLSLPIPNGAPTGDEILYVAESNTGAAVYNVVHIGAVNPLVSEVAGVPLFDILIFLLFVVLLLAVILLWRRTGMGRVPPGGPVTKPSTPPPPPPSGPGQQAAPGGPMSVACKHCGASIEITTSKRPIEVMCPSCGETQVVQ